MQTITQQQKKALKAQAHDLRPIIITGDKGLTDNVIMETERALLAHELIKVRINAADRIAKKDMAETLAAACEAVLVNIIGHIAILYRESEDKKQEDRRQKPEARRTKSAVKRPIAKGKAQKPEARRTKSAVKRPIVKGKAQKPEARKTKPATRRQKAKTRDDRR